MNNDYSRAVKDIASQYSDIVRNSGVFGEDAARITRAITDKVMPLLDFEKPKILIYGIYNSGKSTLVNVLCGREVAEVANRATTYRIDSYDAGKYILVDSPGIDAPIEHEKIADKEINSCHQILFVMSSKGGYEYKKNYEKMSELINKGLPFVIVINERAPAPDQVQQHQTFIKNMKSKILENLALVSGIPDIGSRYDVIVLNAKTALKGVLEDKPKLREKSRISELTDWIAKHLEGSEAMKNMLAPLSALDDQIREGETLLTTKTGGEDYARRRDNLQIRITQFQQYFLDSLRGLAESRKQEIYQGLLGNAQVDMKRLYDAISQEAEEQYKRQSQPIIDYIRANFAGLGVKVDASGKVTLTAPSIDTAIAKKYDESESATPSSPLIDDSVLGNLHIPSITAAATAMAGAGAALGSFVPVLGTALGGALGGIAGGLAELGRQIFQSTAAKEKQEYERRQREIEAINEREARRAEEENRRRQDARVAADSQVNSIIRELRKYYGDMITLNLNGVSRTIDEAISRISTGKAKIKPVLDELKKLRGKIASLRREISC